MHNNQAILQYLHQTLGVNYLSQPSAESLAAAAAAAEKTQDLAPQTSAMPELVFVNYDPRDVNLAPAHLETFEKMVKAMGLEPDQIWRIQAGAHDLPEVLNRLRTLKIQSPVVVMKTEPEIFDKPQNMGPHLWAECFSVSSMMENPQLKKATWKVLQYFIKKG